MTNGMADPDLEKYFRYGQWKGSSESVSGRGSSMEYTSGFRPLLGELLRQHGIETLLDAPSGDFNWMKAVDFHGRYIGMDIVARLVEENVAKYGSDRRQFLKGDITRDALPPADLIMVRDCLFHLPFISIANFFENFLRSGIPLLLVTQNMNPVNRHLKRPGLCRPLNLLKPPFNLPDPGAGRWLRDYPDGKPQRYLLLWTREQIQAAADAGMIDAIRGYDPPFHSRKYTAPKPPRSRYSKFMSRIRKAFSRR